jgi:hypothetical protein
VRAFADAGVCVCNVCTCFSARVMQYHCILKKPVCLSASILSCAVPTYLCVSVCVCVCVYVCVCVNFCMCNSFRLLLFMSVAREGRGGGAGGGYSCDERGRASEAVLV